MTKCSQASCEVVATMHVFWPGSTPFPMCVDCAIENVALGKAAGVVVTAVAMGGLCESIMLARMLQEDGES